MKNLLFVLIGLFIFIGCSKDESSVKNDRITRCGQYLNDIMKNYNIADTSELEVYDIKSMSEAETLLLGTKGKKLWIAHHDNIKKELINTYTSDSDYEFARKYHIDYNNYDQIYTQDLRIENIMTTEYGFIFTIPFSRNSPKGVSDICFIHDGVMSVKNNVFFDFILPWYNGGIFTFYTFRENAYVSYGDLSCCFNCKGTKLFESAVWENLDAAKSVKTINDNEIIGFCNIQSISNTQVICNTTNLLTRTNLKDKKTVWEAYPFKDITGDFIIKENTLVSHDGQYFEYNSKIVYQNGDVVTMRYKIDIETGEITKL